ncbi:hypothetical protein NONO_c58670 [Nocardia nova SH22a]|uniref:Uncharacterized protein n=1 Tax=Nocardia nova SH22a TaxID=1415166 RepID=W5TNC4_9NOCA|nr:hypothetical protein [Nocardia nova]AHH20644.1 hypothetical protein NONO_c58670 [Nocardia nova SH22a]
MPNPSGEFAAGLPADQPRAATTPPNPPGFREQPPDAAPEESQRHRARELVEAATALLGSQPAAAERMLVRALGIGAGALTAEQIARLRSLVVTAIAQQPGRETDLAAAALAAARGWADISAGDAAHHTVIAARIHYRGGDYRCAADLFADALHRGELPYPPEEIAVLYELLGRCLDADQRYRAAARAYAAGAGTIADRPQWAELHTDLTSAAARSRRLARHPGAAVREWARTSRADAAESLPESR